MSQLTLYLDEETEKKSAKAAAASGMSRSQWIREIIQKHTANEWPQSVVNLAGAWPDLPVAEELRKTLPPDPPGEDL